MECLKGGASPKHSSTATKGISSVLFVKKVLHMTFEHSCSRSSIGKHISESYLETIFAHVFFIILNFFMTSAPVWTEQVLFVCRWACLRSTQRSQTPCRWRPKPSSCAALSPTRIVVPPLWTCSPTSSSPSPAARRRARVASRVGSTLFSSAAENGLLMVSSFILHFDLL